MLKIYLYVRVLKLKKNADFIILGLLNKNQNVPIERKARQGQQSKPSPIFISYMKNKNQRK